MNILYNLRLMAVGVVALFFASTASADNGTIVFSGSNGVSANATFGTAKNERYDVAMHVEATSLKGTTISAIRLHLGNVPNIATLNVWLSKTLNAEKNGSRSENKPDILQVEATPTKDGEVRVELETPYTIGEEGVYVGYSMTFSQLTDAEKYPVAYFKNSEISNFYLHTSMIYTKWNDMSVRGGVPIEVELTGGVDADAIALPLEDRLYGQFDKSTPVSVTLRNLGYEGVSTIGYTYTVGNQTGSATVKLDEPLPAIYNYEQNVTLSLPPTSAKGDYPVSLTLTTINGKPNPSAALLNSQLTSYKRLPKHRPLFEEYTGTWCRNCPRGFVGLEIMNKLYPDDFIGLSYHNKDAMEIMPRTDFPSEISGFPDGYFDRIYKTDAYFGFGTEKFGLDKAWLRVCDELAPADIEAKANLSADASEVEVNGYAYFPTDVDNASYTIEVVLTADDLYGTGAAWDQKNDYNTNRPEDYPEPEFEQFLKGSGTVSGLHYNDVVVATSLRNGGEPVLPSTLVADTEYPFSYKFKIADIVNTSGESLVQNKEKLNAVVMIKNAEGKVENAFKTKVSTSTDTGISSATSYNVNGEAVYYSVSGIRLSLPCRGINIVRLADGSVKKIMRK